MTYGRDRSFSGAVVLRVLPVGWQPEADHEATLDDDIGNLAEIRRTAESRLRRRHASC